MKHREHGGVSLSEIGIGCYAYSGVYGRKDPQEFRRTLLRAHELGITLFDTAAVYGEAESFLGETVRPFRREIFLSTKITPDPRRDLTLSRAHVAEACERSLSALRTDRIDLFQIHLDDPATPIEETVSGLEGLVTQGKIGAWGLCHLPPERIEEYCRVGKPFSVMMELSAAARDARRGNLSVCRRNGAAALAFSVTGRGLLTGKIGPETVFAEGDIRGIDPLFQRERLESGLRIAEALAAIGKRHGRTPVQVAIAWVLAQDGVVSAVIGPSTVAHLEENAAAGDWTIPHEEMNHLEELMIREDAWLEQSQREAIDRILNAPLSQAPGQALTDLAYVLENVVTLRLKTEAEVIPLFMQLLPLRGKEDDAARATLDRIREEMRRALRSASAGARDGSAL